MKQHVLLEKYPVFVAEIPKQETDLRSVGEIIDRLKQLIDEHQVATFIAVFDHYAHTGSLAEGAIEEGILDARNIVFCFGIALPAPEVLALRPRSIGVAELADRFVVSFVEAPMPVANSTMESWARQLFREPKVTVPGELAAEGKIKS